MRRTAKRAHRANAREILSDVCRHCAFGCFLRSERRRHASEVDSRERKHGWHTHNRCECHAPIEKQHDGQRHDEHEYRTSDFRRLIGAERTRRFDVRRATLHDVAGWQRIKRCGRKSLHVVVHAIAQASCDALCGTGREARLQVNRNTRNDRDTDHRGGGNPQRCTHAIDATKCVDDRV